MSESLHCASVIAASATYDVLIGQALLGSVGRRVRTVIPGARKIALVTDENVAPLYSDAVADSLRSSGFEVVRVVIPAGEESKTWARVGEVLDAFAREGLDRGDAVAALGGGVVGDIAGFSASVYMRGIAYAQIPTTLLAQVDSSIGGKTGVDLLAGKNLAGTFWQPRIVLADTDVLTTLPEGEWTSGLAEVAKTAFLAGGDFLDWLEASADVLVSREPAAVAHAVCESVAFKALVVSSDERESGGRECLNYGHTLGHAIELVLGYGSMRHGTAVAEGIRFASGLAEDVVGASPLWTRRQAQLLDALGLRAVHVDADVDALKEAMAADKKARGGVPRFVFVRRPGEWELAMPEDSVLDARLRRWRQDKEA